MTTAPNYSVRKADTTRGLISAGEGLYEFLHPMLPVSLCASNGFLVITNGYNLNRVMPDTLGYDETTATAIQLLQMRAPREPIEPVLNMPGEGRILRPGAKWRYSWYDSRTGVSSGLSPIPTNSLNLGELTAKSSTTYLGQTAWFYLSTTYKPSQADTIRLWANTTSEDDVWYLADEQSINGASYVMLTDDNTDDELFLREAVVSGKMSGTPAGMSWNEGVMGPYAKTWLHPSGRVFYFGLRRFGTSRNMTVIVSITEGSDLCTISAPASTGTQIIEPGRVGQRIKFISSNSFLDPVSDPNVYRFLKWESATTFRIYPQIQLSAAISFIPGSIRDWYYEIVDDRDARWTQMGEPGKPWLIDPLKTLAAGDDYDDGVLHWFSLNSRIFMQTKRRIYEAIGSVSDNPASSTVFDVACDEGSVGLWAGCETPFGWVYVHPERGVRVFDGGKSIPLGRIGDPYGELTPQTQFERFEPSMMEEVRCFYDEKNRKVIISYVPTGSSCLRETMVFSTAERNWRGPYRESVVAAGEIRGTADADTFVQGDAFGSLSVREAQVLDTTPSLTSFAGTGTITSVATTRVFSDSAANYTADADDRLRGSPVWFSDGTTLYFSRIASILSATQAELESPPVAEDGTTAVLTTGWTYGIGSIRWSLTTAYLDSSRDPTAPLEAFKLNLRFRRGTVSETFEAACSENGASTFSGVRLVAGSAPAPTRDALAAIHGEMRLKREGAAFQMRLRGTARNGDPQITRAVLVAEEREGALKA